MFLNNKVEICINLIGNTVYGLQGVQQLLGESQGQIEVSQSPQSNSGCLPL